MRRPQGYATIFEPSSNIEYDTITCKHCQRIVRVKPGTGSTVYLLFDDQGHVTEEMGAFCRHCMAPVCLPCDDVGRCIPWEKQMECMEAKDRLRRAVGVVILFLLSYPLV